HDAIRKAEGRQVGLLHDIARRIEERRHRRYLRRQQVAQDVVYVHAYTHGGAKPRHRRINAPARTRALGIGARTRFELDEQHLTDLAAVDDAPGFDNARHEAVMKVDAE